MPQPSRVHELHNLHSQKLAKLEAKREEISKQEQAYIEEASQAWKKNKKIAWEPSELNALDASHRLYNDHRRRAENVKDIVREEEFRVWVEAHPKTNRSRHHSEASLRSAREACARLHMDSVRRKEEFQTKVAAEVTRHMEEFDREPKVANSVRYLELWEDANNRQKRQKELDEAKKKEQEAPLLPPDTRPVDMKRIEDLHNMHVKRKQRRDRDLEERRVKEIEEIAALSNATKRSVTPQCHARKKAVKVGIVVTAHVKNIDYNLLDDPAHEVLAAEMKYAVRKQIVAAVGRGKIAQEDVEVEFTSSSVEVTSGGTPRQRKKCDLHAVVVPPDSGNDNYVFSRLRAGKALGEAITAAITAVEGVGAVTANGVPPVVFNVNVVNKFPPQRAASEERSAYASEEVRQLANSEPSTAGEAVLSSIIAAIELRSPQKVNIPPADQKLLTVPLSTVLGVFREASTFCEISDGYAALCNVESQRIYRDGQLHADSTGLVMDSEPPPIKQPRDTLEGLLIDAKRAQKALQDFFVPESSTTWGPGKMSAKPPGMPMALFAYNPGPKPRDNAMLKAIIRYGPGAGAKRHQYLLDLARMTVVFENCERLHLGLHMILEKFKVLGLRNFFNLRCRKGETYVELLVAVDVQDWAKPEGNTIPHVCELRLEEQYCAKARLVATPHLMEFYAQLRMSTADLGLDADSVGYVAHMTLASPTETHNLRIFRRHLAWCYGSTINGWREVMSGRGALISFDRFMRMCKSLHCRELGVRLWQELDPGYGGSISLFELDPDGVVLMGRLLVQLLSAMTGVQELCTSIDAEQLFSDLCGIARPERQGLITPLEFRRSMVHHFGFSTSEADRTFQYLDNQSGSRKTHSTGITVKDIQWLARIPLLVNLDAVTLKRAIVLPPSRGTGDDDDETLLSTPSTTCSPDKTASTQASATSTPTRSTEALKTQRSQSGSRARSARSTQGQATSAWLCGAHAGTVRASR